MEKRNGGTLILASLMIILFTEIVGINMQIGLNYLPIFFAVITLVLFNFKLKEQVISKKSIIIIDTIIIIVNYLLMKITENAFSCIYCLPVLIFCKFLNKVDFSRKTITIKHTVQRLKINGKTEFIFKDRTKSQSSYRTLPLFDFIETLLKEYKEIYAEYRKIFGSAYCNKYKEYVCLMPDGELMKPGYLSHTFSKLLEDNELKRIRLHDLRHSCATLLIQNKVPVKDIQIWLGHSNIQTTMIYTNMDETNKEVSAKVIINKFQNVLTTCKESEIYKMKAQNFNNLYEDIEDSKQLEKVVATG